MSDIEEAVFDDVYPDEENPLPGGGSGGGVTVRDVPIDADALSMLDAIPGAKELAPLIATVDMLDSVSLIALKNMGVCAGDLVRTGPCLKSPF